MLIENIDIAKTMKSKDISDYELQVQKNIQEKQELLIKLGIASDVAHLQKHQPKPKTRNKRPKPR